MFAKLSPLKVAKIDLPVINQTRFDILSSWASIQKDGKLLAISVGGNETLKLKMKYRVI